MHTYVHSVPSSRDPAAQIPAQVQASRHNGRYADIHPDLRLADGKSASGVKKRIYRSKTEAAALGPEHTPLRGGSSGEHAANVNSTRDLNMPNYRPRAGRQSRGKLAPLPESFLEFRDGLQYDATFAGVTLGTLGLGPVVSKAAKVIGGDGKSHPTWRTPKESDDYNLLLAMIPKRHKIRFR